VSPSEHRREVLHQYYLAHRTSLKAYQARYRDENRDEILAYQTRYASTRTANARARLLKILGPFCAFCGETDDVLLEIDHKAPIRSRERRGPVPILLALRTGRENPFNLQVLCANCHTRKTKTETYQ
jgi:5-methylcytosine-specific restriction endonuclease McrA